MAKCHPYHTITAEKPEQRDARQAAIGPVTG